MASDEFVLDPKYEFCAPRFHDFIAGETRLDVDEAEKWFESARGYEDSPHADKTNGRSEVITSALEGDLENIAPAPVKTMPLVAAMEAPKSSPLREISVNVVDCPATTTPLKRPHCPTKHGQALTVPKNPMRSLTRYARDTVVKKVKKSIDVVMGRDENMNKKQKVDTGCIKQGGKPGSPFMSLAEKVLKFQIKTPERFRNHSQQESLSLLQTQKSALKLTVPKEPDLETSHRARPPRVKSTAELEEEMLAKIPKFKARPVNKKIFEGSIVSAIPKRTVHQPEFQEFHLRTTERALQHLCSTSEASASDGNQRRKSAPGDLTEPREPQLHTASRARPTKVKTREEMELEELQKIPKFKARPLNKKIFESRGDLGIFRSQKRQLTVPVEFHFATDERCQHQHSSTDQAALADKLDKEARCPTGTTVPRPFHLVTEHRGEANKTRFMQELFERELEERNLRVPKANPLPFTTDFPAIPPKPQPKECTRPEPFELESLARHEEELQRKAEELARLDYEEAATRQFHAHPLPTFDSVFMPERSRLPLTEVQAFCFRAEARAVERAEFDRKVTEKQNHYKQVREELEAARRMEENKLVKALRREMVPQARPMPVFGKPFIPLRSKREPTRAVSPRLRVLDRKERRQSTQQRQSNERRRSVEVRRSSSTLSVPKKVQMR